MHTEGTREHTYARTLLTGKLLQLLLQMLCHITLYLVKL
ncbi:hypothetical protein T03_17205 [Trichinella britovi]|uniref:Uncharacterized protein n=1 Tax=Trichinella britovi TaxID=45882 RepID=A0A0V0YTW9_TRIBR|nr:hypothetical protein T03_17205 [Trichinella britovi]